MNSRSPTSMRTRPINEVTLGVLLPRNTIPPKSAKMTSLAWVASTPASSPGVDAIFLVKRNIEVAKTPDRRATNNVCDNWAMLGGGGCVVRISIAHRGKDPTVIRSTLLKAFSSSGEEMFGILLLPPCCASHTS